MPVRGQRAAMENVVKTNIFCSPDSHIGRLSCILRHSDEKEKAKKESPKAKAVRSPRSEVRSQKDKRRVRWRRLHSLRIYRRGNRRGNWFVRYIRSASKAH